VRLRQPETFSDTTAGIVTTPPPGPEADYNQVLKQVLYNRACSGASRRSIKTVNKFKPPQK